MSDLKIFAKTVEQEVHDQLKQLMSVNVFRDAKVRIMPDTHAGKGCVIGFTADLGDKVVPNLVGVDVGCGCYVVNMGKSDLFNLRLAELDKFIHENIPSGMSANDTAHIVGFEDLDKLHMMRELRNIEHLHASVGSLGGGNHFISIECASKGDAYLIIHTGSRNLGQQVCRYYQAMAIEDCNVKSEEMKAKTEQLIVEYKEALRHK